MIERLKQDFQQQWQTSTLLRQGVWGIGIVLLLYLVLWLDDEVSLKNLELQREVDARAELRALENQSHWSALTGELESRYQRWLEHTWQARTVGLAQAQIQEFIQRAASGSEVKDLDIRSVELAQPQPFSDELHELRGRINASARRRTVPWDWITQLESHSPWLLIDNLEIRVGNRSGVSIIIEFRVLLRGLEERR